MNSKKAYNFIDRLEGDKVIWMILLILIMFSILCMFSSTSRMLKDGVTRVDLLIDQLKTAAFGLGIILVLYNIKSVKFFKACAVGGAILSFCMLILLWLLSKVSVGGFISAPNINGAHRILQIGGFQIHVLEAVKISMLMYIAYAVDASQRGTLPLKKKLKPIWQKFLFIYLPFFLSVVLCLLASNSAAIIVAVSLYFALLIGGGNAKEMILLLIGIILVALLCFGIYKWSNGRLFERIGTGISRVFENNETKERRFLEARPYSPEYYDALDEIRQPFSARIAIHEGGLFGKLPGQSTQKYKVSLISEDYIFSFIIEEYGFFIGVLIIVLYLSLLARASMIVRGIKKDLFSQLCIAGLCFLISAQAFLHIFVNLSIGPMTGQTLPMVSHGRFAFLCFSIAFGVILSLSRIAKRNTDKELRDAQPLINFHDDEIQTKTFVEDEI